MSQRYIIKQQFGAGRAGAVYHAFDAELGRNVAFRRFDAHRYLFNDPQWRTRYYEVVGDLCRINHSNILSVLDAGIDELGPYLVSAHVEGTRLSKIMNGKGLEIDVLHSLAHQCLEALQAAEEYGFYHHALCPSSILGGPKISGGYQFILMDLGHSKLIPLLRGGDTSTLSATLDSALMAPEVYDGRPQGIKSSLYMVGQLLYWAAVGGHPLAGLPLDLARAKHGAGEIPFLRAYRSDMPENFRRWIYWLIEPDPADRPLSAAVALSQLPSLESVQEVPVGPRPLAFDEKGTQPYYET